MSKTRSRLGSRRGRSVFLTLFLIYLATTVALILGIGGASRLMMQSDPMFKQTRGQLIARSLVQLMDELGDPPDRRQAERLVNELGLAIRVETPETTWATDPSLPPSSTLTVHHTHTDPPRQVGRHHGRFFVVMDRGTTRYVFFMPGAPALTAEQVAVIVAIIAIIVAGSYAAVRWLFRPLDWLSHGVAEIARGNLDHRVPVRSQDELGRLTAALNDMAERVADMLHARERLLLDVSHELRSPLTRMKVAVEFVPDASVKSQLQEELRELEAMVTELLESERLNSTHGRLVRSEFDVVAVVRELVDSYKAQPPGVRFSGPSSLRIEADAQRLRMAIRNVLDNALTYSARQNEPVAVAVGVSERNILTIAIADHGPGIPADEQPRIFEPFYRVDRSRTRATGGYGLGLSLAKKIMQAHGGDIGVQSEMGKGSRFVLSLPLSVRLRQAMGDGL